MLRALEQRVAEQAAMALENARLFETEQRRAEQFRLIGEVGSRITSILDVDELLSQTARLIHTTFGFHHVHLGLIEGDVLHFKADGGVWGDDSVCHHCDDLRPRVGRDGVTGWVAGTGEALIVPDVTKEPRYIAVVDDPIGSNVTLPLKVRDKVIGTLEVESERLNAFDEIDVAVLQSLADQVAVAIENGRLYRQAQSLAALQERQKLARELHDSVSQALYGMSLGAHTARALLDRDPQAAAEPLDYVISLADAGLAEMRALIFELRPESLEIEGLVAALTKQAEALRARHGLAVEADLAQEPAAGLEVKEALYRIAQEAMHNTVKHARATRLELALREQGREVILEVQDDGIGFDPGGSYPGHLGLQSMRERVARLGGQVDVQSAPGRGTTVRAALPLAAAG
jgi:signal transduction histidine kinase